MPQRFDLIVIGSGSGLDVANGLASRGWRVAIVEQGPLGGTCLNRGCIPSKMLLHSADVVETIRTAHHFGVHVKGYDIDFPSIVRRVTESVDKDAAEIEHAFESIDNPKLFKGEAQFVGMKTLQVDGESLQADKFLLASGGRPLIPEIPGLRESGFITSDEALRLTVQPREVTILGGGYIAVELAHFFGSLGTRINIVQRHPVLVPREDEEVSKRFTEIFRGKHNVLTGFEAVRVTKQDGVYRVTVRSSQGGERAVTSDTLLVAAGRAPSSDVLNVARTGVKTDAKGFIVTDEYLRTNVPGIFSLGDAVGHFLFKHSANLEAQYDYYNLLDPKNPIPVDYTAMPHAIFTSPQIAGVGKTEQELKAEKFPYLAGRYDYIDTAMGHALEDRTGFVKILVTRDTGKILGCHILGTDASTLIHEVLVAMRSGDGTLQNITHTVHIHPALSEVIQRAAANLG